MAQQPWFVTELSKSSSSSLIDWALITFLTRLLPCGDIPKDISLVRSLDIFEANSWLHDKTKKSALVNHPRKVLSTARRSCLNNKVGEISAIAREVSDFTTAGQRVPPTVWEKYDRLNKRHKKEEGVVAIVTKTFNKKPSGRDDDAPASAERVDRSKQQREEHHPANNSGVKLDRHGRSQLFKGGALGSDDHRAGSGGNHYACTFGSGRCDTDLPDEGRLWPKPPSGGSISSCNGCPTRRDSSWGRQERQKLNELCELNDLSLSWG